MARQSKDIFWISYSDLMTSLFFVVLVLFVLTYMMLKQNEKVLQETVTDLEKKEDTLRASVKDLKNKLRIYDLVEQNLKPLKENSELFRYEKKHKRFTLAFEVNFETGGADIKRGELRNYTETARKIKEVGKELQQTIDNLAKGKTNNPTMDDLSYLLIISGSSSHLDSGTKKGDYILSYKRAFNLWLYWKKWGIDFEAPKYNGLIDLQISGNGWGGIGRFKRDSYMGFVNERKNQRFIIQIVPKIGNAK